MSKSPIVKMDDGRIFESISDCCKKMKDEFGIILQHTHISKVCKGKLNQHKGFKFKYLSDINSEELNSL
jgi:hypothetical protein